jgi:hypothetical protein
MIDGGVRESDVSLGRVFDRGSEDFAVRHVYMAIAVEPFSAFYI